MSAASIDRAACTAPAARRLLDEPTSESRKEPRSGTRGGRCVTLTGDKRSTWFDHEAGEGGGALDLIARGTERKEALRSASTLADELTGWYRRRKPRAYAKRAGARP